MQKKTLYRFFEGKTTIDEEKCIRQWLEQSKENKESFLKDRLAYDVSLFNTIGREVEYKKREFKISPWQISTVAAIALLLIISGLYFVNNNHDDQYNTIIVPAGQRINLILADKTNVWLNSNTKFEYPSKFAKNNRTVYLDGEAYFEVSDNNKRPFKVKTTSGDVQVTGTKFNVEAYSKLNNFVTSLFEGGVEIYKNDKKLTSLMPNEQSTMLDDELLISEITEIDEFLWRTGLIAFNNKELDEILFSLEKYFDIEIKVISENLPQHTYSGKFRQSDGVEYALRVLQRSINFEYERNDITNTIYIK